MKFEDIEAFLAVYKYGSFSRAAEKTFTTQPSISQHISALEKEFDARLFIRQKGMHQILLTPEGEAFLAQAQKWETLWKETSETLKTAKREIYRFKCVVSFADIVFPKLQKTFEKRRFNVSLVMTGTVSREARESVEQGRTDCALICQSSVAPNLSCIPVAREKMFFVCRNDASYGEQVAVSELPVHNQILIDWNTEFKEWNNYHFGQSALPHVHISAVRRAAQYFTEKDDWSIVPASYLPTFGDGFRVCRMNEEAPDRFFYLISLYPYRQPYYSALIATLDDTFKKIKGMHSLITKI